MMFASDQDVVVQIECPKKVTLPAALPGDETFDYITVFTAPNADIRFDLFAPNGLTIASGTNATLAAGIILPQRISGRLLGYTIESSIFAGSGTYTFMVRYLPGGIDNDQTTTTFFQFQWGGVADDIQLARKYLTNRIEADFTVPTAPVLTVYDDDNTVLGTRTAQNANGSAVSENQITNLTKLTP